MNELHDLQVIPAIGDEADGVVNELPAHDDRRHSRNLVIAATETEHEPSTSRDRISSLRLLTASAFGIGCLLVAHWLQPAPGALFAAPSTPIGWVALGCGMAGVWLVPGLWLSALVISTGAGPASWLGTRIATTLAWYALVGPVIHISGQGARVTVGGILITTVAATIAVSVGVALSLSRWPTRQWQRLLVSAVIGGVGAQAVISVWMNVWVFGMNYAHIRRLDWLIVLVCALLVILGAASSPQLPGLLSTRNGRTILIVCLVLASTTAALLATSARWSPAQRMPSAFGIEQVPAPPGADVAFMLTAIGPEGPQVIRRSDFTASDDRGRRVPVAIRLENSGEAADHATLLVTLAEGSRAVLCAGRAVVASATGAPIKVTVRDRVSGVMVQSTIPEGWCAR